MEKEPRMSSPKMIAQRIQAVGRTYELRHVRCGRQNCSTCYHRGLNYAGPPGHGPYWYLCTTRGSRTVQMYVGKILDTAKWMTADGSIDWAAYKNRTKKEKKSCDDSKSPSNT